MSAKDLFTPGEAFDRPLLPRRQDAGPWVRRAIVFVTCALALNALIGDRGLAEMLRARQQLRQTAADLDGLRRTNANLATLIENLNTDVRTIENIAREELGLIRKGEVLVVVKDVPAR
jgi:cell division protein FtsB